MSNTWEDIAKGFGAFGANFVVGSSTGGPAAGLVGGLYGAAKFGLDRSRGKDNFGQTFAQSVPVSLGAGILLRPSLLDARQALEKAPELGKDHSLLGLQTKALLGSVSDTVAGGVGDAGARVGAGISSTGSAIAKFSEQNASGLSKAVGGLLTGIYEGKLPDALAKIFSSAKAGNFGSLPSGLPAGAPTINVPVSPTSSSGSAPSSSGPSAGLLVLAFAVAALFFMGPKLGRKARAFA